MVAHNFDGASNILSVVPVVTGRTVIPPGVVGGFPVLLPQISKYSNSSFKVLCTCFSDHMSRCYTFMVLLGIGVALTIYFLFITGGFLFSGHVIDYQCGTVGWITACRCVDSP